MEPVRALALTVHLVGFALWIGSLFGMASTLAARNAESDSSVRMKIGVLARRHGRSADIGATLAIVGGLCLLAAAPGYYMHQPWMHAKLTLVLGVLGLHGFLRVKAKRAALDGGGAPFPAALSGVVWLVGATIVALVVFKPWAH
jgi:putative membrane protein